MVDATKASGGESSAINANTQPVSLSQFSAAPVAIPGAPALDLASLRLPQDFGSLSGVKKILSTVPTRKPSTQSFFRVRAGEEYRLQAAILQMKDDGDCFLVMPNLYAELSQEVRRKVLYTGMTREGNLFLWPVNLPGEDGRLDTWSQSAHAAAAHAENKWIRLVANRGLGAYDILEARGEYEEPEWPEQSFQEIVNLAFKDKLIQSLDHPVIRRLRGEA